MEPLFICISIGGMVLLLFNIWAIIDVSKQNYLTREEKHAVRMEIWRLPIYGLYNYLFEIKKR
jgi:hypothetical protein